MIASESSYNQRSIELTLQAALNRFTLSDTVSLIVKNLRFLKWVPR
jgi:hypothetical protein